MSMKLEKMQMVSYTSSTLMNLPMELLMNLMMKKLNEEKEYKNNFVNAKNMSSTCSPVLALVSKCISKNS